ncbi:ABC transporter permease [Robbsia andropogonis]|uniref:ABC transporter permease n=1 Tax=Robbsia andropogonis TaxID=28092 RepID=UPI002A69C90D|nr:ABC transporter permease [Robbsia andropogonis]
MKDFPVSPGEIPAGLWRNRRLIRALTQREVAGRYRGSAMGIVWSFVNPAIMLVIYTVVFSVIFKSRWGGSTSGSKVEFALILFPGLIVFNLFAECFGRAPGLILSNVNYVKKVIFPLEILPWVALGSALFHACISILVWLIAYLAFFGLPHPTFLLLPVVLLPLVLFVLGLMWSLSALGVYVRDISQFLGLITTCLMFMSPIFYSSDAFPARFRFLLNLNPLSPAIEGIRDVLFWGKFPDLGLFFAYLLGCAFVAYIGFAWFQKTRKGFADVL